MRTGSRLRTVVPVVAFVAYFVGQLATRWHHRQKLGRQLVDAVDPLDPRPGPLGSPFASSAVRLGRRSEGGDVAAPLQVALGSEPSDGALDVALIFDESRLAYAGAVVRSVVYHTPSRPLRFHLIAPVAIHTAVRSSLESDLGPATLALYDYEKCSALVKPVLEFSKTSIHPSAHCKLFLAYILGRDVERVLYLDNDLVVVDDLGACFPSPPATGHDRSLFSMAVDMGDACQRHPNRCWPLSLTYKVPDGLKCGNVPRYFDPSSDPEAYCPDPGDDEPAQVNGGVMLLELARMREVGFKELYISSTASHYLMTGRRRATWGEQDFVNSFFRLHPDALRLLPCGCNYQWSAIRRHVKCPRQPITVGHGWSGGVAAASSEPFNRLFHFFLDNPEGLDVPPAVQLTSPAGVGDHNGSAALSVNVNCLQQDYACSSLLKAPEYGAQVFVLTRTSGRPHFFREMLDSVYEQTYPYVTLFVVTDDERSLGYLDGVDATLVRSLRDTFDPAEACRACGLDPADNGDGGCADAPPPGHPKRPAFLRCFCQTRYPMNRYMDVLHKRVTTDGRPGWILYLDDDNLLTSPTAISRLMLDVRHRDQLVLFRSRLARLTPSAENFGRDRVVMGDVDASNMLFHSRHIPKTAWRDLRCGDWRTAASLASQLEIKWSSVVPIMSHPLRPRTGGLGLKRDLHLKVTVVITSYQVDGFRPTWVQETLRKYSTPAYAGIIDRIVLIWNNPFDDFPGSVPKDVIVVRSSKNSLNNRWLGALPYIRTDAILNLDDDVFVDRAGILCMLQFLDDDPTRLVGPFVRRHDENTYIIDELLNGESWSMALPRVLLLSRKTLDIYASPDLSGLRDYVDLQEAHCDDIVLNAAVANITRRAPLRVLLPPAAINDYYYKCFASNPDATGGLGLQKNRLALRQECFANIMSRFSAPPLRSAALAGVCGVKGVKGGLSESLTKDRWLSMMSDGPCLAGR